MQMHLVQAAALHLAAFQAAHDELVTLLKHCRTSRYDLLTPALDSHQYRTRRKYHIRYPLSYPCMPFLHDEADKLNRHLVHIVIECRHDIRAVIYHIQLSGYGRDERALHKYGEKNDKEYDMKQII